MSKKPVNPPTNVPVGVEFFTTAPATWEDCVKRIFMELAEAYPDHAGRFAKCAKYALGAVKTARFAETKAERDAKKAQRQAERRAARIERIKARAAVLQAKLDELEG